ncbi:hypothetical protein O6H91_11G095400 [Diphasiastrum complanatum]|uniref:Uncharacterized protein n=1 Tax=Diphasiastrum complanatum TaxID=34168 RepID=A0ACC2CC17_DIPCM|nr:hypothetical protein O6H91_11G095400 [Diphasiastrum complanatum]
MVVIPIIENQFRMEGGVGDCSYARNSALQATAFVQVKEVLAKGLLNLELPTDGTVVAVADLGCSTGPNTVSVVNFVVGRLRQRFMDSDSDLMKSNMPDFQAFFSDLPSNDFNTLFQMLCALHNEDESPCIEGFRPRGSYFVAGVPGSFYKRLFPRSSLHIPPAVQDKNSPAWNKGESWINHPNRAVAEAYEQQAKEDLSMFLVHRATELAPGGLLFLLFGGREDASHPEKQLGSTHACVWTAELDEAWRDLANEGLIDADTRDSFNFPMYYRSVDEFQQAVNESSLFIVQSLHQTKVFAPTHEETERVTDPEAFARRRSNFFKSVLGGLVEAHIGPHLAQVFFKRLEHRVAENAKNLPEEAPYVLNVACLTRTRK